MINLRSKIAEVVLSYFFLHPDEEMYINEMAGRFSLDSGNLTRKLSEIEKGGLLKSRVSGKQRYYSLNKKFPLYAEYKKILLKTVGIEHQIRQALERCGGVKKAFIFGSYATDKMDNFSDIDLFVISDQNTVELYKVISKIEKTIDRQINITSMDEEEFQKKRKTGPFISAVLKTKTVNLI
ncbi:MAG: nucleotidyltransferase domain-containing protein [Candidatus Omnitrophica bacterium]|nr:nucleotidyltransferase domain-containing protein [Candidatus Omnitrophota bacterium]